MITAKTTEVKKVRLKSAVTGAPDRDAYECRIPASNATSNDIKIVFNQHEIKGATEYHGN